VVTGKADSFIWLEGASPTCVMANNWGTTGDVERACAYRDVTVHPNGATHVRLNGATETDDSRLQTGVIISLFWVPFQG